MDLVSCTPTRSTGRSGTIAGKGGGEANTGIVGKGGSGGNIGIVGSGGSGVNIGIVGKGGGKVSGDGSMATVAPEIGSADAAVLTVVTNPVDIVDLSVGEEVASGSNVEPAAARPAVLVHGMFMGAGVVVGSFKFRTPEMLVVVSVNFAVTDAAMIDAEVRVLGSAGADAEIVLVIVLHARLLLVSSIWRVPKLGRFTPFASTSLTAFARSPCKPRTVTTIEAARTSVQLTGVSAALHSNKKRALSVTRAL